MSNKIIILILLFIFICCGCSTISGDKSGEYLPNFHIKVDKVTIENLELEIRIPKKESNVLDRAMRTLEILIGADLLKSINNNSVNTDNSSIF